MNSVADWVEFPVETTRDAVCESHGEYLAQNIGFNRVVWSRCPKCQQERELKEQAEREQREREAAALRWERMLGHSGIPERFKDRTLESYLAQNDGQRRALKFAAAYANAFDEVRKTGRSAVFLGKPGTGKTHLSIGIGLQIMQRDGRTVLFETVVRAIRRIKATWSRDSEETETEAIAAFTFPDLLILDEVGVQFGSETEKLMLFDVLNERYEQRRPTLLLSNLAREEVKGYLGERVFDRMREDGGQVVVFDWESHRGMESRT